MLRSTAMITDAPTHATATALGNWMRSVSDLKPTATGSMFMLSLGDPKDDFGKIQTVQVLLAEAGIRSR